MTKNNRIKQFSKNPKPYFYLKFFGNNLEVKFFWIFKLTIKTTNK